MYRYRNKRTGAVFTSPCRCGGGDWEETDAPEMPVPDVSDVSDTPEAKRKRGVKSGKKSGYYYPGTDADDTRNSDADGADDISEGKYQ